MFMQNANAFADKSRVEVEALVARASRPLSGLIAGTRVESAEGWRAVEDLTVGDGVFTHDGGLVATTRIMRRKVAPRQLIHVPGGALGNCADVSLLPGQHLLIEHEAGARAFGSPWLLVPAAALVGLSGVRWRRAPEPVEVVLLHFAAEEVVWANSGLRLYCPTEGADQTGSGFFATLTLDQGLALVAAIGRGEAARAARLARAA